MPNDLTDLAAVLPDQGPPPADYSSLAQILGYAPVPVQTTQDQQTPDAISSAAEPTVPNTPGPVTSPLSPSPSPSIAQAPSVQPPVITPQVAPTRVSASQGGGFSHEGFNQATFNQLQAGPHAGLNRGLVADEAAAQAKYAPITAGLNSAESRAEAAQLAESQTEAAKIAALSVGKQQIANANQDFLAKEQAAVAQSRLESQSAMSNYRAALADFAAARVNPAQLWDNAGTGGQFQLLATAFVHDFLGAKGIQTSGLDSIKTAIQQNIDGQLQNLRKKEQVAAGFKTLWDMQRAQSATDAEARQRMNGFYLQALTNQVDAQMGQYDSKLALAKGQAAVAKLQEEMLKNDLLVQKHVDDSAQARMKDRIQVYGDDLKAASERYAANAHIAAAQIAANAKEKPVSPLDGVIFDTSQTGGNFATRRFLPDVPPEARVKIRQQTSMVGDTVQNIEKLIQLQDQISKVPPTNVEAIKKLQSEEARTAELLRNVTKMGIIYDNSGKQINEQEVKLYDEIVGKKDWWTNGDNVRTLGTLAQLNLQKNNAILGGVSTAIVPGDPVYGFSSGKVNFDPGNTTLTDIQSAPGAGRHQENAADQVIKEITAPDATKKVDADSKDISQHARLTWNQFYQQYAGVLNPDKYGEPGANISGQYIDGKLDPGSKLTSDQVANLEKDFSYTKGVLAVDKLAQLAEGGDKAAFTELESLAKNAPEGSGSTKSDDVLAAYAAFEANYIRDQAAGR